MAELVLGVQKLLQAGRGHPHLAGTLLLAVPKSRRLFPSEGMQLKADLVFFFKALVAFEHEGGKGFIEFFTALFVCLNQVAVSFPSEISSSIFLSPCHHVATKHFSPL